MSYVTNDVVGAPNQKSDILIGYPRLDIAPYANPGTYPTHKEGWRSMGLVEPGSVDLDFGSEIHDVTSGSPATVKQRFVVARMGKMSVALAEWTPLALDLSNGSTIERIATYAADGQTTASALSTELDEVAVTSATGIAVGDTLEIAQGSATYGTWLIYRRVLSITGTDVVLDGNCDMLVASGAAVKKVASLQLPVGGNLLKDWQARLVFSATNGDVVIFHFPLVNVTEAMKPNVGDGKTHVQLPMAFEAIGMRQAVSGMDDQVVVANIYTMLVNS